MAWTEERTEILKKRWAIGWSAGAIAKELGNVSRNGVIGKVHRLGLALRSSGAQPTPKPKPSSLRTVEKAPVLVLTDPRPIPKDAFAFADGVPFLDIGLEQCRWPNDGSIWNGSFRYCGQRVSQRVWGPHKTPSCPYCDEHADRAISKRAA
jgi:GcrA cell cycle regulator